MPTSVLHSAPSSPLGASRESLSPEGVPGLAAGCCLSCPAPSSSSCPRSTAVRARRPMAPGYRRRPSTHPCHGPAGEPVDSTWPDWAARPGNLVAEMAGGRPAPGACRHARDPGATTTTIGVGELDRWCSTAEPGASSSAAATGTCDGGAGALSPSRRPARTRAGYEVDPIGSKPGPSRIETSGMDPRLRDAEVLVAGNMHNLLTSVSAG